MTPRQLQRIIIALTLFGVGIWALFEFGYKGTVSVSGTSALNLTITDSTGHQVYGGSDSSLRLLPGTYNVSATDDKGGISQPVAVSSFATAKLTIPENNMLSATPIAQAALYQPIVANGTVIGFDPTDNRLKRLDSTGSLSLILSGSRSADADPEIPGQVQTYHRYRQDQAIVSSNNQLYVVSATSVDGIATDGITFDPADVGKYHLLVATQPGSDAFVVAYKKDVFRYENAAAKPQKIYTAKKEFDSLLFGKSTIGLYDTSIPPATQNITNVFADHQIDLLLIDTAAGNQEQTRSGPIAQASLSPDGDSVFVQPRNQTPYLFSLTQKKQLTIVAPPLVAGPLWTDGTHYLYSGGHDIWQFNTTDKQAILIAALPDDVTSLAKNGAGEIIASTYPSRDRATLYRVGAASANTTKSKSLNAFLPYATADFSITYSGLTGTPTIVITTQAPLNSASQLPLFRQNTLTFRQQALDYLKNAGVDLNGVTIIYNPADPL